MLKEWFKLLYMSALAYHTCLFIPHGYLAVFPHQVNLFYAYYQLNDDCYMFRDIYVLKFNF